jgi:glycosyltransferase involved in cell wall biosynthesis
VKGRKLIYIISLVEHSVLFRRTLNMLRASGYQVQVVLLHSRSTRFEEELMSDGIPLKRIHYHSKLNLPSVVFRLTSFLQRHKDAIVHTHLFEAGLAGMISTKLAGVKRRIHTRHDAMIHHDFHPQAVKYDRMTNSRATQLIAITDNVRRILIEKEHVPAAKIEVVHHGFHIDDYAEVSAGDRTAFAAAYPAIVQSPLVVGVISRLIEWKGIQYIIAAFHAVLAQHPQAHLVLANARGPYEKEIRKLLSALPAHSYTVIEHESRIAALYESFDVFVHAPVDELSEAFGQVYIEAMAAGIPSVITRSGIACDYARDKENCLIVPHRDSAAIGAAILLVQRETILRETIVRNAQQLVQAEFTLEKMIHRLTALYDR